MMGFSGRRRRVSGPRGAVAWSPKISPQVWLLLVGGVALLLSLSPASRASLAPPAPSPLAAPTIDGCNYIPDPRSNASLACGDTSASAIVNVSIFFQVNVSDTSTTNMSVTFFFDYLAPGPNGIGVNPTSPNRTVNVTSPGLGQDVSVNTTWTYTSLNANFSWGYFVDVNVTNDAGENASTGPFPVYVGTNSPPYIDGLVSLIGVSQSISPANPVIPLVYLNVTAGDPDADPVTVTWYWGDGTNTVNRTGPLTSPLTLNVTHQYPASIFPLNQTPRYFDIPIVVWIDDGRGHNVSQNSTIEFYLDYDFPPTVRIEKPTVGSVWKVGEPVAMVGNVTDREGSPITAYWDFDNRTDSTGIGDPTRNQDALGLNATHTYTSPGIYYVTLWATDGNKETCFNQTTCSNFTTHWTSAVQPIDVRNNIPPVLAIDNATTILGTPIRLRASVYDGDGDSMAVRWVFGDGSPDGTNVTGTSPRSNPQVYEVFQNHNYTRVGNDTLTVYVSDGNATVSQSVTIFVQSFNLPPVLLGALLYRANGSLAENNTFPVNTTVIIRAQAYDPENDTLNVSVDWGDGSTGNLTVDPKTASNCVLDNRGRRICTVSFQHVYSTIGSGLASNYTIDVTLTDNQVYYRANVSGGPPITLQHVKELTVPITITGQVVVIPNPWDWWDYSTLSLVLGIPTILVARFAWKVRRERREA